MNASEKIQNKFAKGLHICVGLDTDINRIPTHLLNFEDPLFEFNKSIIESTMDITAAYKINFAFYESLGIKGWKSLEKTVNIIPSDVLTIADAKRGDIGNTSEMYAKSIYDHLKFDAVTLNPYMGFDSIMPFQKYEDKINFILALTSNSSSSEFEKQKLADGQFLYQSIIDKTNEWNNYNNLGIVFGATNSEELKHNINNFKNLFLLLPGVGAQGGSLKDIVKIFKKAENNNYLVNISRSLIYSSNGKDFGISARKKLKNYNSIVLEDS